MKKCELCKSKKDIIKCDVYAKAKILFSDINLCAKCRAEKRLIGSKIIYKENLIKEKKVNTNFDKILDIALFFSQIFIITGLILTTISLTESKKEIDYLKAENERLTNEIIIEEAENLELKEEIYFLINDIDVYKTISSIRENEIADIQLLAKIIYSEAGNQEYEGMIAVGNVVLNRVNSDLFPDTVEEVIYQSGQFSSAGNSYFNSPINEICLKAAVESYYNKVVPKEVLFFHADYVQPNWYNAEVYSIIDNHIFYRLKDKL